MTMNIARRRAIEWWLETNRPYAICDVCGGLLYPKEGYVVDNKQIIKSRYWRKNVVPTYAKSINRDFGFHFSKEELRATMKMLIEKVKNDPEPWLICRFCYVKMPRSGK